MMATQAGQSPWEVRFSTSRKIAYFFNHETGASEWEPPAGLSELQIRQLPGAEKYLTPIDDTMRQNAHQPGGVSARTLAARQQQQEKPKKGVRARHILAKHSQSRRPSSWRQVSELYISLRRIPGGPSSSDLTLRVQMVWRTQLTFIGANYPLS